MEQHHRSLIDSYLPDLIMVTIHLETVVNKLLENEIINEWMKRFILVNITSFDTYNSILGIDISRHVIVFYFHLYRVEW